MAQSRPIQMVNGLLLKRFRAQPTIGWPRRDAHEPSTVSWLRARSTGPLSRAGPGTTPSPPSGRPCRLRRLARRRAAPTGPRPCRRAVVSPGAQEGTVPGSHSSPTAGETAARTLESARLTRIWSRPVAGRRRGLAANCLPLRGRRAEGRIGYRFAAFGRVDQTGRKHALACAVSAWTGVSSLPHVDLGSLRPR